MIDQTLLPPDPGRTAPGAGAARRPFRVGAWMTAPVQVVTPGTPVLEAYEQMINAGIRRLPVVTDGRLVGIVTLGDLREARPSRTISLSIYELNYLLARLTVEEIMTHNPYTVLADAPAAEAAVIMLTQKVGGLPVVDAAGRLVGIITESDLFRLLIRYFDN
jgi:acetoin utilization protein AcuB